MVWLAASSRGADGAEAYIAVVERWELKPSVVLGALDLDAAHQQTSAQRVGFNVESERSTRAEPGP